MLLRRCPAQRLARLGKWKGRCGMNAIAERIHLIERIAHNDEGTLRMLDKVIEVLVEQDRKN